MLTFQRRPHILSYVLKNLMSQVIQSYVIQSTLQPAEGQFLGQIMEE